MTTVFSSGAEVRRYFSKDGGLAHSFDNDMRAHTTEPYRYHCDIKMNDTGMTAVTGFEDPDRHGAYFEFYIHMLKTPEKKYKAGTVHISFSGVATHDTKTFKISETATDLSSEIMKQFKPLALEFVNKDVSELHANYAYQMHRTTPRQHEDVIDEFKNRTRKLRFIKKFVTQPARTPVKESIQNILDGSDD
jgi:hypothetical protein